MGDMQIALRARIVAAGPGGGAVAERVHWAEVPQNSSKPYVVLQVVSDVRPQHLKGYDGSRPTRVQVDVYADSYAVAKAIAEDLITALDEPAIEDGVRFGRIKAEGPRDLGESTASGFAHRASMDLLVRHRLA